MYLAFLSLYLLTSDLSKLSNILNRVEYLDRYKTKVDFKSYCADVPCIVKCCEDRKVLNYASDCIDGAAFRKRLEDSTVITGQNLQIESDDYRMILAPDTKFKSYQLIPHEIYISKNGSVKIRVQDPFEHWMTAPPQSFCMELIDVETVNEQYLPFAFMLAANPPQVINAYNQFTLVVAGLLISLFLVLVITFCVKPRVRSTVVPVLTSLTFTLIVGYVIKIVQLCAVFTNDLDFSNCRSFSVAYYFIVLSNFFWANIIMFDMWWRIRGLRKYERDFYHEDFTRFFLYCMFGWGVPALLTFASVAVDISDLNTLLSIEKPSFDNGFNNDKQSTLYLHVPIAILITAYCVFMSLLMYQISRLRQDIYITAQYNNTSSPKMFTTTDIFIICLKLSLGFVLVCIFAVLPDVPLVPYVGLVVFTVYIGIVVFFTFVFNKSQFVKLTRRFNRYHHLSDKFEALDFLREASKNTIGEALLEGLKKGDDSEITIDKTNNTDH